MDKFTPEQRSKIMSAIHSRDTLVESLIAKRRFKNLQVALVETTVEIIAALEEQKDGK